MKNLTKICSLILALVLVIGVLAACKCGSDGGDTSAEATGSDTPDDGTLGVIKNYWPTYDTSEYDVMRAKLEKWFTTYYVDGDMVPFSLVYGGKKSENFISSWKKKVETGETEEGKTWKISYENPDDKFTVWGEFVLYGDYPTLEWTTYAKNCGMKTSPVIYSFNGCDISYVLDSDDLTLHTTRGSLDIIGDTLENDDVHDYELVTNKLSSSELVFVPETNDGRPTEHAWPYFDVIGSNNGIIFGIGWTGVWNATFSSNGKVVKIDARQNGLKTVVHADETIRTPLYSLTYFDGDAEYGHNVFRRTVLSHYTPDDGTETVCKLPISVTTESYGENYIIPDVGKWVGKLSVDGVWTDAAWFGNLGRSDKETWGTETGNWWVSPFRYPSGSLKRVSDFLHENDKKYIVWFEMERAAAGTELYNNSELVINKNIAGSKILNLASEKGFEYMRDFLVKTIGENNIDIFRQDFNSPGIAQAWAYQDSLEGEQRNGMTEMRYIENLYRVYDTLLSTFPGIMLDNCSSGGKRLDLELMKRMVILHLSDYTCVPYSTGEITTDTFCAEGQQYLSQNLAYWFPLYGHTFGYPVQVFSDGYILRSAYSAATALGISISYAADMKAAKKLTRELSDFRGFYTGDYYSLMTPTIDRTSQQSFMFVREDVNEAMVLLYTRPEFSGDNRTKIKLKGLDENTTYLISDQDSITSKIKTATGKSLMEDGLSVTAYAGSARVFILTPYTATEATE